MILLNQSVACKRLRTVGLTQNDTLQILDLVHLWTKENGEAWVVNRLKQMKVAYINKLAKVESKDTLSWIKNVKGVPSGPFKRIFQLKKPQKALSALMIYSSYKSSKLLKGQWKKFHTAVTSLPNINTELAPHIGTIMKRQTLKIIDSASPSQAQFIRRMDWSDPSMFLDRSVRIPFMDTDGQVKTHENNSDDFVESFNHPVLKEYFDDDDIYDVLPKSIQVTLMAASPLNSPLADSYVNLWMDDSPVGKIGFIQEPGLKLRTVANPFPSIQVALSRIGNQVYNILRMLPTDATFDQDKAVKEVQTYMNSPDFDGLMSIDLSSATDRFPLSVQMDVLHSFVEEGWIDLKDINLFEKISKSEFSLPRGSGTISWKTGQPLGVYPSFGVFALTHNILASACDPKFFRVLGDDIVIDRKAGELLRGTYKALGLVISEEKSINSDHLAEFGGRLITKTHVYIQPKWKEISDRSFIDLARNLGPKSLGMFQPRQQKVLKVLADVHPDVHPWGLNWNLHGVSYAERIRISIETMAKFMHDDTRNVGSQNDLRREKYLYMLKQYIEQVPDRLESRRDPSELESFSIAVLKRSLSPNQLSQIGSFTGIDVNHLLGVSHLHIHEDDVTPFGFHMDQSYISDPRGLSTLEVAERKMNLRGSQSR